MKNQRLLLFLFSLLLQNFLAAQGINFDGFYTLTSKATAMRLDGDFENIYPHETNDTDYQKWEIKFNRLVEGNGNKAFTVISKKTGFALEADHNRVFPNGPHNNSHEQNLNQLWVIEPSNVQGYFTLRCLATGKRLDGTTERLYPFSPNGGDYQRWKIEKVPNDSGSNFGKFTNDNKFIKKDNSSLIENPYKNNLPNYYAGQAISIFSEENWRGAQPVVLAGGIYPNLLTTLKIAGGLESVKSIRLSDDFAAVLFTGENFTGQPIHVLGELGNLKKGSPNGCGEVLEIGLSDRVKSMLVMPKNALVIFNKENYDNLIAPTLIDMESNEPSEQKYSKVLPSYPIRSAIYMAGTTRRLKFWAEDGTAVMLIGGKKLLAEQAKILTMKNPKIQFVAN